jgi:hypothetical protein
MNLGVSPLTALSFFLVSTPRLDAKKNLNNQIKNRRRTD